jgi:hypothetical protein
MFEQWIINNDETGKGLIGIDALRADDDCAAEH